MGNTFAQLTVVNNNNPTQLAQVLAGSGVTVSNATINCPATSLGTFNNGNTTNLGLNSGVVLTTGTVAAIPQGNGGFASTDNTNGGDANLNSIASAATQDVCVLTFQIVPQGNQLRFDYVFGSEEYPEYVCSNFNDVFGFFITGPNPGGPAYNANNIALIPGTGTSVAINTVNSGTPGAGYSAAGCQSLAYSGYYVNNGGNTIVYDGFTTVFTSIVSVVPCQTYTLKLAIGDVGDGVYDSGVFLEASSFTSQTATVVGSVVDPAYNTMFEGCVGGQFAITIPNLASSSTAITYTMSGTATNGVDYLNLNGTAFVNPGTSTALVYVDPITDGSTEPLESVTLTVLNPCNGQPIGSATINLVETPDIDATVVPNTTICAGTQVQLNATGAPFTNYSWSPPADVSNSTIANPTSTPTATTTYTVSTNFGTCVRTDQVTVDVVNLQAQAQGLPTNNVCPNDTAQVGVSTTGDTGPMTYQWSPSASLQNDTIQITEAYPPGTTTYNVTVTDVNSGCSATSSVTINVYNLVPPSLGPDQNICPDAAATPVVLSPTGGPFSSFDWSTTETTSSISVTTAGTYDVTVVETSTGCELVSQPVTIVYYPVIPATLSDTGFCPGETIVLSANAGFTNVVWSTSETTNTISVSTAGTFYYSADDNNGCAVNSDTISTVIGTAPFVNATASPDTICAGGSSILSSGAAQGLTYNWLPSNGNTSNITVNSAGIYIVAVSDQFCTTRDTVEVFQYNTAPVSIGSDQQGCESAGDVFTLNPSGGPYTSYNWSNTQITPSITVSTSGSYNVSVVDPITGCQLVSNTVVITINPETIAALSDTGMCPGETITLSALPTLTDLLWSTGAQTTDIQVSANGTFWYVGEDQNGCPAFSDTATVTMGTPPAVNATASPDTICIGGSTTLSSGAAGNLQYLWTPGNQITSTITVSQAGTYNVRVSDNFCPSFDTVEVYQYAPKTVLLNADTSVCPGASVVVTPSGAPYVSYLWSNTAVSPTITVSTVGNYSVLVNDGQCSYPSDTFTLSNIQVATPNAFSDTTVCSGEPVILTSEPGFNNYGWSNSLPGSTTLVVNPGSYSYTATDGNNCTVTSNSVVVTHNPRPNPNITAVPAVICVGQGSSTLSVNSEAGVSYVWFPAGSGNSIQVTTAGTYVVEATLNNCVAFDTLDITSSDTPSISLPAFVLTCGDSVVLEPAPGQSYSYLWSNQSTGSTVTVSSTNNVTEVYSVTATNSDGCTATSFSSVIIKNLNAVAVANPDTIFIGDSAQICVNTDFSGSFTYLWSPGALVSSPDAACTFTSPVADQTYTATVVDADGCVDSASVVVYVIFPDNVAMPNAFTPNGDGKNDVFYPVLLGNYQKVTDFRIYNRWGELVHSSTDPWNGDFKNSGQPAGTYVYYVVVNVPDIQQPGSTKDLKYQGSFTLLR
ncbi:MAG: gliding motility-associated C-terminal domain-containing protein [Bacteroidetes bacterium]|nr:gliding motility-associated C-terminal domain-containing protein [Bacteroidota bacterium]